MRCVLSCSVNGVSIPFSSGRCVSHSYSSVHYKPRPLRLNPLLVGAVFLTLVRSYTARSPSRLSQSPSRRGGVSHWVDKVTGESYSLGLNPLLVGAVFLTLRRAWCRPSRFIRVSIPFSSGRCFSPFKSDAMAVALKKVSIPFSSGRCFSPAPCPSRTGTSSSGLNPLLVGAVFLTTPFRRDPCLQHDRLNPLLVGAVFLTLACFGGLLFQQLAPSTPGQD